MEQRLIQSPQMIQAMQVLQLPLLELSERIEQELTENPFLEVVEPERDAASADGTDPSDGGAVEARVERADAPPASDGADAMPWLLAGAGGLMSLGGGLLLRKRR